MWWGGYHPLARQTDTHVHSLHRQRQPSSGKKKHLSLLFSSTLVIRVGARPNLDFTVHASVYGKVLSPPRPPQTGDAIGFQWELKSTGIQVSGLDSIASFTTICSTRTKEGIYDQKMMIMEYQGN